MTTLSLEPLLDRAGLLLGLAIDHRDSLDVLVRDRGLDHLRPDGLRAFKTAVVRSIGPAASALMLDHDYGAAAIASGAIPPGVGLIMPLEAQGYAQLGDERSLALMDDFGPAQALELGAAACKLLVPIRADRAGFTSAQLTVVDRAVAASHSVGLPIVLEPLVYRLSAETAAAFLGRSTQLIVDAVALLAERGADLLKLPFPSLANPAEPDRDDASRAACAAMHSAAAGVPWVLYGAGAAPATFEAQLRIAGEAGGSGFLVGRSVWLDALLPDLQGAEDVARASALPRFLRFAAIARETCRPARTAPTGPTAPPRARAC